MASGRGVAAGFESDGLGLDFSFFFCIFLMFQNFPPFCVCYKD